MSSPAEPTVGVTLPDELSFRELARLTNKWRLRLPMVRRQIPHLNAMLNLLLSDERTVIELDEGYTSQLEMFNALLEKTVVACWLFGVSYTYSQMVHRPREFFSALGGAMSTIGVGNPIFERTDKCMLYLAHYISFYAEERLPDEEDDEDGSAMYVLLRASRKQVLTEMNLPEHVLDAIESISHTIDVIHSYPDGVPSSRMN